MLGGACSDVAEHSIPLCSLARCEVSFWGVIAASEAVAWCRPIDATRVPAPVAAGFEAWSPHEVESNAFRSAPRSIQALSGAVGYV
jgi:hypothetical protein